MKNYPSEPIDLRYNTYYVKEQNKKLDKIIELLSKLGTKPWKLYSFQWNKRSIDTLEQVIMENP